MRIGFITPEYPCDKVKQVAGLGTSLGVLAKALVREGHIVYVFVYGQDCDVFINEEGVNIYLIANVSFGFGKWFRYRKYIQKRVQNIIEKEQIAILEVPDWTGISAFMRFSIPVVMRFHGSDRYFCHLEGRKQKWKNKLFEHLGVRGASAYIAPTTFAGQLTKTLFKISDNKSIETIKHGLPVNDFKNLEPSIFESRTILYIGTIIRKKGVLELPEIFNLVKEQVPDAKLVLIGSDAPDISTGSSSTWELMKHSFEDNCIKDVQYLGKVPYNEVQTFIKTAHVCVFPTFAETFGMVTVEAMALQKPVVNSNIGWAQELMEDGKSGFLMDPEAHKLYADKVITLLQDEALCLSMGQAARRYVEEHFDMKKQATKNIEFYKKIIEK
ncbi:Glycosyltransferase [Winogradskyella psychrotolerans RS-3]|uniref:Glycosyltransferase n=1 Tax=Winogradskyella psychrotolerans RS-3 TaxID=641526 RepID=S7XFB8_9FLAO|nr:glycosyltransferase family 4 protein [Winogradskyella psychrotolerans]EPR74688.1 Glycosyltransferase [Winogradskyella psychrotolerans RS-3]